MYLALTKYFPLLLTISFLYACTLPEVRVTDKLIAGKIDTEVWTGGKGNAYLVSSNLKYRIQLLSDQEPATDPCASVTPSKPYLSFIFLPSLVDLSIPFVDFQETVLFHGINGLELTATSGFLSIYDVDRNRMLGLIQADFDDNNHVEGTFEVWFCN